MKITLFLIVTSLLQVAIVHPEPPLLITKKQNSASYAEIKASLSSIVQTLGKISSDLKRYSHPVCNTKPVNLDNAETDWREDAIYSYNDTISVRCKEGFMTENGQRQQTARCLLGNEWSAFEKCSEEICTGFPSLSNARRAANHVVEYYRVGERVTVKCDVGFFITNQTEADQEGECLSGNQWSPLQSCEAFCTKLPVMPNAEYVSNVKLPLRAGSEILYRCTNNYNLKNTGSTEQTAKCLPGDEWTQLEPCMDMCPSPFKRTGSICIEYDKVRRTWSSAKSKCAGLEPQLGSRLAMLQTKEKQMDFLAYVKNNQREVDSYSDGKYLDAHDRDTEGAFVWGDGTSFVTHGDFQWDDGEPNNDWKGEDCVSFHSDNSKLNDLPCTERKTSFCEIPLL